ncbi:CidA/LrgA family protein [Brevibacillus sp. B_LB10_24]|uniref:CidA/LrgA family protein n=1 Tax=Brevibacillus sp. B_LB10_24 TaxID=3380645 RepID=UPI0038BA2D70
MSTVIKRIWQIALLIVITMVMNGLVSMFHLPVPGSILGMIAVYLLLQAHIIKLEWLELGGSWLLSELLLFFIPPAVGVIQFAQVLKADGERLLLAVILSTAVVMACAGLIVQYIAKRKEKGRT